MLHRLFRPLRRARPWLLAASLPFAALALAGLAVDWNTARHAVRVDFLRAEQARAERDLGELNTVRREFARLQVETELKRERHARLVHLQAGVVALGALPDGVRAHRWQWSRSGGELAGEADDAAAVAAAARHLRAADLHDVRIVEAAPLDGGAALAFRVDWRSLPVVADGEARGRPVSGR